MAVEVYDYLHRAGHGKDYTKLEVYKEAGGFEAAKKALQMDPAEIIAEVKAANVRGRGGAGFPAGVKWGFIPKDTDKPIYLVVNADEGEPGTFKDRYFLEHDPFRLIEGCIIACRAIGAHTAYIYIRGEFFDPKHVTDKAIKDCYEAGILGKKPLGLDYPVDVYTHPGAGAYVCGEETALLESLEGRPGQPRLKPPFPAVVGAFGCPTIVNNVESISTVPVVLEKGAQFWADLGVEGDGGTRLMGISGHVKKPGVYELATGTSLKEIIYDVCGGIIDDRELKAVIPGGSSTPVLLPDEIDIPMSIDGVAKAGSMLGTCGVIVMAEGTCMVKALSRLSHFYAHESCGQCTPCREGSGWVARVVDQIEAGLGTEADVDLLTNLADQVLGNTICALGDALAMPASAFAKKFRGELLAHIEQGGCPFEGKPLPVRF